MTSRSSEVNFTKITIRSFTLYEPIVSKRILVSYWVSDATRIPVSRSKRTKDQQVTRPINAYTHRAPYHSNGKAYTNFKLGIRMEDDDPHQPQAPWPSRLKVKVARSRDQSEPSWPNTVPVSLEAGGGIPCWPNSVATLLVLLALSHCYSSSKLLPNDLDRKSPEKN